MLWLLHDMNCTTPRTMAQLLADGYTRDQVYNAVKRGQLVNLAARDAWGRRTRGPGLFSNPAAPAYNAGPLLSAWSK